LFVNALKNAIGAVAAIPAAALPLAIAHAAYESDWGITTGYRQANNPWNITAGSTVPGPDTDGSGNSITQQWRAYPDLATAAADYWNFLGSFRYVAAQNAMGAGDPNFATLLGQEGYYTQDPATYQSNINSIIGSVNTYLGLMP
jgi:flagellum-specific peptidoglycan hydrolase FlgJ